MSKTKWNYAVVRDIFGGLWIGKTKLVVQPNKIFANIADASNRGGILFEQAHPDFDTEEEDNNDMDLQRQYDDIIFAMKDDVEKIPKECTKFIA